MPYYKGLDFSHLLPPSLPSLPRIDQSFLEVIGEQHKHVSHVAKFVDSSLVEPRRQIMEMTGTFDAFSTFAVKEVNIVRNSLGLLSNSIYEEMQKTVSLFVTQNLTLPVQNSLGATLSSALFAELSIGRSTWLSAFKPALNELNFPTFFSQQMQNAMLPLVKENLYIGDIAKSYNSLFNDVLSSIRDAQANLELNLRNFKETTRRRLLLWFVKAMLWPVPSMSDEFVSEIDDRLRLGMVQSPQQLIDLVQDYYMRENWQQLEKAVFAWWDDAEYAVRRIEIEQALNAQKLGWYALTIRGLLDLVEGIARDSFHKQGYSLKTTDEKPVKIGASHNIVARTFEVMGGIELPSAIDLRIQHDVMVRGATHFVHDAYKEWDFRNQYDELRNYTGISRHGLSHGGQIAHGSCMNALRCFLLLDALYGVRKHYATNNGFGFF